MCSRPYRTRDRDHSQTYRITDKNDEMPGNNTNVSKVYTKNDKTPHKGGNGLPALCGVLGTGVIILVILALLPLAGLRLTGHQVYYITSGSMSPSIPVGSAVITKAVDPEGLTEGDIIAYYGGDTVVVHRVVKNDTKERTITTKGDANDINDPRPVPYSEVAGIVTAHYAKIGSYLAFLGDIKGKITMAALIVAGLLLQTAGRRMRS